VGEGLSQCGHFADKERGVAIFLYFVRTSFKDGPLALVELLRRSFILELDLFTNASKK